jgi:hypothetical protein
MSPNPGTIAGPVNQLAFLDQTPSVEPSQMSLVALPVVGNSAKAFKKSSDEMLLERTRFFDSGERMAAGERLQCRTALARSDKHHAAVRATVNPFPIFRSKLGVSMSTQLSMQIAFDARTAQRASYGRIIRAQ